jgi:HSP20 family protein
MGLGGTVESAAGGIILGSRKQERVGRDVCFLSRESTADDAGGHPRIDVFETRDSFIVTAELPGVTRNDVRVEVSGCELSITGERRFHSAFPQETYRCLEGTWGRFHRQFTLPHEVNQRRITTTLKYGILNLVLPKATARERDSGAAGGRAG